MAEIEAAHQKTVADHDELEKQREKDENNLKLPDGSENWTDDQRNSYLAKEAGLDVNSEEFKKHLETLERHDAEHDEESPAGSENWTDAQWDEYHAK